jgi:hypothetical protein
MDCPDCGYGLYCSDCWNAMQVCFPSKNEIYTGLGITITENECELSVDKEWIKSLLMEFNSHQFPITIGMGKIDNFLEKSKIWNEK